MRVCDCCDWRLGDRRRLVFAERTVDGGLLECDGIQLPELCADCEAELAKAIAAWLYNYRNAEK